MQHNLKFPPCSPPREAAVAIELAEAATCESQVRWADSLTKKRLGLHATSIGSGTLMLMTASSNLYFNRLIGLGLRSPANIHQLRTALGQAKSLRAAGLAIDIGPFSYPKSLKQRLEKLGFQPQSPGGKLWRDDQPLGRAPRPEFSVRKVARHRADDWIDVVGRVWRTFRSRRDWYRARIKAPDWTHYLAWDGDTPIASGALHITDVAISRGNAVRVGHLVDGVTLTPWRRQGCQTALIRRRVRDGLKNGCRWFTSETAPPLPRMPLVSFRNLLSQGFQFAYLRSSWAQRWR